MMIPVVVNLMSHSYLWMYMQCFAHSLFFNGNPRLPVILLSCFYCPAPLMATGVGVAGFVVSGTFCTDRSLSGKAARYFGFFDRIEPSYSPRDPTIISPLTVSGPGPC